MFMSFLLYCQAVFTRLSSPLRYLALLLWPRRVAQNVSRELRGAER